KSSTVTTGPAAGLATSSETPSGSVACATSSFGNAPAMPGSWTGAATTTSSTSVMPSGVGPEAPAPSAATSGSASCGATTGVLRDLRGGAEERFAAPDPRRMGAEGSLVGYERTYGCIGYTRRQDGEIGR